jgi:hypothetical protein
VGFGDYAACGPDALRLPFEQPLGVAPKLGRLLLGVGEVRRQKLADMNEVQVRPRLFTELYSPPRGERRIRGAVGGEQHPRRKEGHAI